MIHVEMVIRVPSLKNLKRPVKDAIYEIIRIVKGKKRRIGFKFTGKAGFGKWKIVYNKLIK